MKWPKVKLRWSYSREDVVLALVAVFGLPLACVAFWMLVRNDALEFPGHWGQLGDFVGGFLNPVVALAALYMLAQSVRIQRKELAEARDALRGQAASAQVSVEIAGYTAAINAAVSQVAIHQTHIDYLMKQIHSGQIGAGILSVAGAGLNRQQAFDIITELNKKIEDLMNEQDYFAKRLKVTLRLMGHSQID